MVDTICLNEKYSTTRILSKEKSILKNSPEDKFESVLFLPENKERTVEGGLRTKGYFKKSYPNKPLISIVTVVYNGEKFLEEAIESVINQNYDNVEYIVIDGGSTDGSIDIIKKYEDQIDYWVSEPDEGQSDAFIKAFSVCQGEWLTWLNGDDILLPGALSELVQTGLKHSDIECFTGNVIWTTADNKIIQCRKGEKWNNLLPKLGVLNVYGPTTFFKKDLYEKVEGINRDLHYKMDTDIWWQFYKVNANFMRLKLYTWTLRLHEDAKMSGHNFENSTQSDLSHPSWKAKRKESKYIEEKYKKPISRPLRILGKITLLLNRLMSWEYLESLYHTQSYANKHINEIYLEQK